MTIADHPRLASIGTLIIITAFAFEPFIQQVVSYPSQQVDGGLVSSIPRSQNYTAYIQQYADPPTVTPDMRKAIHLVSHLHSVKFNRIRHR